MKSKKVKSKFTDESFVPVKAIQNGTIILLHDYNNLRNKKSQTIQALEIVIPKLKEMGYKFVTVSELIDHLDDKEQAIQKQ